MAFITVIIPVKNGEASLEKCLFSIKKQTIAPDIEIIVLDSSSADKSVEIAIRYNASVITIPDGTFNHGLTRNAGVEYANGELLYFTVQDGYLAEDDQLERMAYHFTDERVQSVTGIQGIPSDADKNPAIWFKRYSKSNVEIRHFEINVFQRLSSKEKLDNSRWDNVNSMYRKLALQLLPFRRTDFGEDMLWAFDALSLGWKLIRDPSLLVYHYHHQTFRYAFRTGYVIDYVIYKHFNLLPAIPFIVKPFAQNTYTILKRSQFSILEKGKWILHNGVRHIANLFSAIVFRLTYYFGKQKGLEKSYKYFCSTVPQGMPRKVLKYKPI